MVTTAGQYPSTLRRGLITATVMMAMLMQLLDMTIANVALPHMQAALSATPESIVWVLTFYILAAAIATPITGWLEARIGRRRLFMLSISGFTLSSALCGVAPSLEMMVAARTLQGLFGAALVPLGQATMLDSAPPEKRAQSLMILTIGLTTSPILGPIIGGWITDTLGWRWVFFINLPFGILALVGVWLLIDDVPLERRRFDLIGFAMLSIALASLQLMLDRGTQLDWFQSSEIWIEAGVCISAMWVFVVHCLTKRDPLIPLALFRDRNFVVATVFLMLNAGIVYSGAAQIAPMLQFLFGYDPIGAGLMMAPRGLGSLLAMPLVTPLTSRVDPRFLVAFGIGLVIVSLWMLTGLETGASHELFELSGFIQGLGVGFSFLPLTLMTFATLDPSLRTEGASINSLARNVAGSVCISLVGAMFVRNVQTSHSDLVAHITPGTVPWLGDGAVEKIGGAGQMAARLIDAEINRQAAMIAYLDGFWITMWFAIIAFPLILLLKAKAGPRQDGPPLLGE